MDRLIAKIYEFRIRRKLKKYTNIRFEYFLLVARGFTMHYVQPNTLNRVTVIYQDDWWYNRETYKKTFKNIKEAYRYFK